MERSFEKNYSAGEKEKETEKTIPAVEISQEEWQSIETIAKRVGGDFDMEVKLGQPGDGSFFNMEDSSIIFDPLHIKENPEQAKFLSGHEGSHRAITPNPKEIGLSKEQVQKNYSQIGFGYLQNAIEDPAVNNWMRKRFPGLEPYIIRFYDNHLKKENAVLGSSEVKKIASQLGYWPKFAQYGSEVIRDWHQNRFSEKLDPAVKKALERTIRFARESISIIPDSQELNYDKKKIVEAARKRFENNINYIWPEVKKLVEMDLQTEEIRQMLNELGQKQEELEQKIKEKEEVEEQGDSQKAEKLQKEIEDLKQELDRFNRLPADTKKELKEQTDKAMKEAIEQLNKEIQEIQKQIQATKEKQQELAEEIQELEEKAKNANGKEKEEFEKEIAKKKDEKLEQEIKQKQTEQKLKDIQDTLDKMQSGEGGVPYPENNFSEETKKELKKFFENLPQSKKQELRKQAEEQLEDFEDVINEVMAGKLNEDKPESHKIQKERDQVESQIAEKNQKIKENTERMEQELERIRKEKMTSYEQARNEVLPLIDDLYYRLRKILKPEEYGGEELAWPSGKEIDITRAMQAEIDSKQKGKMWHRESLPEKKDYRFWHLIDLSGSMQGEKIRETFKGFIVAGEAIDRIENLNSDTLNVHQGIIGFHNIVFPIKEINERFDKEIEDKLAGMEKRTNDNDAGTNTYAGTIKALEKIEQNLGESGNYLLTFSDGEPNSDITEKLKEMLKKGKERRKKLGIKVGLIWLGESENEKKLQGLVEEYGYDFGLVMSAINPKGEKGNFAEKLAELMEGIVKNPEKY